jgi:hypothetical protein
MNEFRQYIQEYIDTLQKLLQESKNDDLLMGKAYEIFRNPDDPRYQVLARRWERFKATATPSTNEEKGVFTFKLVDKDKY